MAATYLSNQCVAIQRVHMEDTAPDLNATGKQRARGQENLRNHQKRRKISFSFADESNLTIRLNINTTSIGVESRAR